MTKTYRVEIKSLFIKDLEANNEQEAKAKMKEMVNPACSIDFANQNGTFFESIRDLFHFAWVCGSNQLCFS